ncbi:MAG: hypothetical protein JXJ22_16295 [Bacteroidales bacterium]|nr:hypothetical protein [Bacteroidales bacterium]
MRLAFFSGIFFFAVQLASTQEVYYHVSNTAIYSFLDEMAGDKLIELNSAVKPYSRIFIAKKLSEIEEKISQLNKRQQEELFFYLKDFNKELQPDKNFKKRFDLFYYKDSLFTFSLNAIAGIQYWSNQNGSNYHRWNGAEVFAYAGEHFGFYAGLRDNHEKSILSDPEFLTTRPGAKYKSGQDFSEMRGGLTWAWKWGIVGLVKDHMQWGNFYQYPSIISDKAPSFAHIKLNLKPAKWFEFNYVHGWLVSGVVDSISSYRYTNPYGTNTRLVYRNKYMAANLFTFKPFERFFASVGNSIIYSDKNIHPAYLIPIFLYKSVDHTLNQTGSNQGGENSQLFFDISSRQINHLHLYATLFFDDLSFTRFKQNGHFDYYSLKFGFQVSNLVNNIFLRAEYFQSYPLVYKHDMPTTTYESNFYNLGHYLQDNSREIYVDLKYIPIRGLSLKLSYDYARHGPDHESLGTPRLEVVDLFLNTVEWQKSTIGFSASYQVINDLYGFLEIEQSRITGDVEKYTPGFYYNSPTTLSVGINFGF